MCFHKNFLLHALSTLSILGISENIFNQNGSPNFILYFGHPKFSALGKLSPE
jgi:hypothetical protein